jgi:arabinose-5-phosphate isomerase
VSQTKQHLIIESAMRTIQLQASSIQHLTHFVDDTIMQAVDIIAQCKGRLVISGIGKSAIVAQKIVATMNSTGTPALFMHAADAIHGDLGMIQQGDVVMLISKSGDSPEIKVLAPLVKNFGNTLIGMVGNMQSYLAAQANIIINTTVEQEACPNNLAPTTSTTAQMVMGDVLAICLMESKAFNTTDFAKFHPGGALGKKMYLRVADLIVLHEQPIVFLNDDVKKAIIEISKKRLGATVVLNEKNDIEGIITDGDVRRMFEKYDDFKGLIAKDIMTATPKSIGADKLAVEALEQMKSNNISQLVVVENGTYIGILCFINYCIIICKLPWS